MSHARREALKAKGQALADAWNAKYPVGTAVIAYPMVRPEDPIAVDHKARVAAGRTYGASDPCETLTTVTRTPAWPLGDGTPVVSVEGYPGGIVLGHIDVIDESFRAPDHTVWCLRRDFVDSGQHRWHWDKKPFNPAAGPLMQSPDFPLMRMPLLTLIVEAGERPPYSDTSAAKKAGEMAFQFHDMCDAGLIGGTK